MAASVLLLIAAACQPTVTLQEHRKPAVAGASLVRAKANGSPLLIENGTTSLKVGDVVFELEIKTDFKPAGLKFKHFVIDSNRLVHYQSGTIEPSAVKHNGKLSTFSIKTDIPQEYSESLLRVGDFDHDVICEILIKPKT